MSNAQILIELIDIVYQITLESVEGHKCRELANQLNKLRNQVNLPE
jgi:hypothetical protein